MSSAHWEKLSPGSNLRASVSALRFLIQRLTLSREGLFSGMPKLLRSFPIHFVFNTLGTVLAAQVTSIVE